MTYLADAGERPTPLHVDDGTGRPLCGTATAGPPVPDPFGWLVCGRCAGISLRAEADRIDPPVRQ